MPYVPSEEELLGFFDTLSNWGRWGADDELGTLNYITPEVRRAAAAEVLTGRSIGCARPIVHEAGVPDVLIPPQRLMIATHDPTPQERAGSLAPVPSTASDYLLIAPHGVTTTHVDTLSHFSWQGKMYNGIDATAVGTLTGAARLGVETMSNGVVTRGVLLDIARLKGRPWLEADEGVFPEDLEAAEQAQGVTVRSGDALFIHTGWYRRRVELGPYHERLHRPGFHAAALPWLHEREVALIAADASQDVGPSGYRSLMQPVHAIGMVAMGLCIIDACDLEPLSEACAEVGKWSFMFALAPLNWPGATASPATPLAVL